MAVWQIGYYSWECKGGHHLHKTKTVEASSKDMAEMIFDHCVEFKEMTYICKFIPDLTMDDAKKIQKEEREKANKG